MFGLPEGTDLTPLHGKELVQVCIGSAQLQLHFSDGKTEDVNIYFECLWNLQNDNEEIEFSDDIPDRQQEAAWLTRLIGKSVTKTEIIYPGTLKLFFSNGWILSLIDDNPHYESYQIKIGTKLIVV